MQESKIQPFKPAPVLTDSEKKIIDFERYGIAGVQVSDVCEYGLAWFDNAIDRECAHLIKEKETKEALLYI